VCAFVTRGAWILLRPTLLVRDLISVHVLLFLFFFLSFPSGLLLCFRFFHCSGSGERKLQRTRIGFQEQNCIATFGSGCISSEEFLLRGRKCQSSCYFVAFACFALDLEKEGTRTRIGFQEQNCIAAFGSGCISSDEVSLRGRKC